MSTTPTPASGGALEWPNTTGPEFDTHDGLGAPWEHAAQPDETYF